MNKYPDYDETHEISDDSLSSSSESIDLDKSASNETNIGSNKYNHLNVSSKIKNYLIILNVMIQKILT